MNNVVSFRIVSFKTTIRVAGVFLIYLIIFVVVAIAFTTRKSKVKRGKRGTSTCSSSRYFTLYILCLYVAHLAVLVSVM